MPQTTITLDEQAVYELPLAAGEVTQVVVERDDDARFYVAVQVYVHITNANAVYADTADTVTAKDPNVIMVPIGEWTTITLGPGQRTLALVCSDAATISVARS